MLFVYELPFTNENTFHWFFGNFNRPSGVKVAQIEIKIVLTIPQAASLHQMNELWSVGKNVMISVGTENICRWGYFQIRTFKTWKFLKVGVFSHYLEENATILFIHIQFENVLV